MPAESQFSNFSQWHYYQKLKDFGQDFFKSGGLKKFGKYFWAKFGSLLEDSSGLCAM